MLAREGGRTHRTELSEKVKILAFELRPGHVFQFMQRPGGQNGMKSTMKDGKKVNPQNSSLDL